MLPGELPTQRIYEVVDLEPRPSEFKSKVGFEAVPSELLPKCGPRSAEYLGQVEWAWSPAHNRIDAYYLHRARRHWILWLRYWDDNWGKWDWEPVGCVDRKGVTERQAAIHLLLDFWKEQTDEEDLDQFHWINEEGNLTVSDMTAIARAVWGAPQVE
jgi:hypothetical protein